MMGNFIISPDLRIEVEAKIRGILMERWLPVIDYAVNKRVSISTLRRRIKSKTVEHRLENGRYMIRTEIETDNPEDLVSVHANGEQLQVVQNLVAELKKAYGLVLAEKEELIQQLRSEIETLRHINQFLEMQIINSDRTPKHNSEHNNPMSGPDFY